MTKQKPIVMIQIREQIPKVRWFSLEMQNFEGRMRNKQVNIWDIENILWDWFVVSFETDIWQFNRLSLHICMWHEHWTCNVERIKFRNCLTIESSKLILISFNWNTWNWTSLLMLIDWFELAYFIGAVKIQTNSETTLSKMKSKWEFLSRQKLKNDQRIY